MHAANANPGKHAANEHSTSKMAGMDHHHHHPFRREPRNDYEYPIQDCIQIADASRPWFDCYGPTKRSAGANRHS
jgi:hypothetical protein